MAVVKLKSEKRLKQVDTGSENANTYEAGDIVYSTALDTIKKSDGTNWQDVGIVPVVKYKLTASGTDHYVWNGPGFENDNDPVVYLVRGAKYQFENLMNAHPFRISNSDGGAAYTDGITNNNVQNGILEWEVMQDAPATMYYNCTSHANMKGTFKILDASGGGGGATNLSISNQSGTTLRIESSTGNNVDIPLAGAGNNAGLMSDGDKDKLDALPATPAGGDANKFLKVNGAGNAVEYVTATIPTTVGQLTDVAAIGGGDGNKFVKVNGASNALEYVNVVIPASPMFFEASVAGSNVAVHTQLNGGSGGTIVVTDNAQNSGGTNAGHGIMVNTASLTQTGEKARYEIISAVASKGFRFKADTTAIASFGGGQAQIAAGTGNNDGVSVSDAQKLVLLYTGSAWKYMIQSI